MAIPDFFHEFSNIVIQEIMPLIEIMAITLEVKCQNFQNLNITFRKGCQNAQNDTKAFSFLACTQ
jgi:hypothetical protein